MQPQRHISVCRSGWTHSSTSTTNKIVFLLFNGLPLFRIVKIDFVTLSQQILGCCINFFHHFVYIMELIQIQLSMLIYIAHNLKECSKNSKLKDHLNLLQKCGHLNIEITFMTEYICPSFRDKLKKKSATRRNSFLACDVPLFFARYYFKVSLINLYTTPSKSHNSTLTPFPQPSSHLDDVSQRSPSRDGQLRPPLPLLIGDHVSLPLYDPPSQNHTHPFPIKLPKIHQIS